MSTILVIDDSPDVRRQVTEILGSKYKVLTAESWSKAFQIITSETIDLMLLDVNLPGLQGDEIVSILTSSPQNDDSPSIVLFSSLDRGELRKKAVESGAHGSIQKTLDPARLEFQVSKYLRKRAMS